MGLVPARRPGWLLEGRGDPPPRGMAAQSPWRHGDGQNPAYRPPGKLFVIASRGKRSSGQTGLLRRCAPRNDVDGRLNGEAEEIGRLGVPALAVVRQQGPRRGQAAPVRPRRLQRDRRPARAQGAQQQGALVFLSGPRRRVQQELELFRRAQPRGSGAARGRRFARGVRAFANRRNGNGPAPATAAGAATRCAHWTRSSSTRTPISRR